MNTHLSAKPQSSPKPALLAEQQKHEQAQQDKRDKPGKTAANLGLRYPKDLERCFVLGNN
ncbi:hypothetical protein [Microbulbifer sp.]|uniref:hypothetical protein n=1 Tax=Microbulbifer sp. TaxID=1908541 RepID=UPI002F945CB6